MGEFHKGGRKGGHRGGGFRGDFGSRDFGEREMHKATCADCGNECEVPFKPKPGRDVFCKECYRKRRPRRF